MSLDLQRLDLNRIATFVRVVELGSFTAAAQHLGLPTSSVSRAVAHLEADLGVRLLQRTTRKLQPTDAGQEFFARVRPAVAALDEAANAAVEHGETPRGTVRLTAAPGGVQGFLATMVVDFLRLYPEIRVELILTPRFVDLVGEGVDLALRAGKLHDSSLMARKILSDDAWLVAAPAYLAERPAPRSLDDLAEHACVLYGAKVGPATWQLQGPQGEREVEVFGSLAADEVTFVVQAVLCGAGIGLVPSLTVRQDIERGTLVRLLPDYARVGATLQLVWPSSAHLPARVTLLRDFLVERMTRRCAAEAEGRSAHGRGDVPTAEA